MVGLCESSVENGAWVCCRTKTNCTHHGLLVLLRLLQGTLHALVLQALVVVVHSNSQHLHIHDTHMCGIIRRSMLRRATLARSRRRTCIYICGGTPWKPASSPSTKLSTLCSEAKLSGMFPSQVHTLMLLVCTPSWLQAGRPPTHPMLPPSLWGWGCP